jgi:hypothetical protein
VLVKETERSCLLVVKSIQYMNGIWFVM